MHSTNQGAFFVEQAEYFRCRVFLCTLVTGLGGLLLPTYMASKKLPAAIPLLTMEGM